MLSLAFNSFFGVLHVCIHVAVLYLLYVKICFLCQALCSKTCDVRKQSYLLVLILSLHVIIVILFLFPSLPSLILTEDVSLAFCLSHTHTHWHTHFLWNNFVVFALCLCFLTCIQPEHVRVMSTDLSLLVTFSFTLSAADSPDLRAQNQPSAAGPDLYGQLIKSQREQLWVLRNEGVRNQKAEKRVCCMVDACLLQSLLTMAAALPVCYHGPLTREECEELLGKKNKDGAYLIRDSETIQGAMCLCV